MFVVFVPHDTNPSGLLPGLEKAAVLRGQSYVVNVASVAHCDGSCWLQSNSLDSLHVVGSDNAWSIYSASKAANVLFGFTLARLLASKGIASSSYHPGVMMTDLWRAEAPVASGMKRTASYEKELNASELASGESLAAQRKEGSGARTFRNLLFCCVKHPLISAAGLASLASPWLCSTWWCHQAPKPCITDRADQWTSILQALDCARQCICAGGNGGYYQQCLCCAVIPVRPSPILYNQPLQEKLWKQTLLAIKQLQPSLHAIIELHSSLLLSEVQPSCMPPVSPAWPCTELISHAPYCVFLACLC